VQVQPAAFGGAHGSEVDVAVGDQPTGAFLEDDQEPPACSEATDGEDFAAVPVLALLDTVLMSQRPEEGLVADDQTSGLLAAADHQQILAPRIRGH
jgi:hypothetical protein